MSGWEIFAMVLLVIGFAPVVFGLWMVAVGMILHAIMDIRDHNKGKCSNEGYG